MCLPSSFFLEFFCFNGFLISSQFRFWWSIVDWSWERLVTSEGYSFLRHLLRFFFLFPAQQWWQHNGEKNLLSVAKVEWESWRPSLLWGLLCSILRMRQGFVLSLRQTRTRKISFCVTGVGHSKVAFAEQVYHLPTPGPVSSLCGKANTSEK